MKKAFSLIELLISLIVISVIIASFAPIIIKKLGRRELAYSSVKQMKIDCSKFDSADGQCLLCDENQCNLCTSSINVPDGYYVNPSISCSKKSCSDFDSNCKRCTKDGCQECKNGYTFNSSTKSCSQVKCNKGYKVSGTTCAKCETNTIQPNDSSTATSCTSCTDGKVSDSNNTYCYTPEVTCTNNQYKSGNTCFNCPTGCTSCTSNTNCISCENGYQPQNGICVKTGDCLIINVSGKEICVAKFNAGDPGGLSIPDNIEIRQGNIDNGAILQAKSLVCWQGKTGDASCDSYNGGYSGCNRTVCNWDAADAICKHHGWRLPAYTEARLFANYSISKGSAGLQLCHNSTGNSSAYCPPVKQGTCKKANTGNCQPFAIWMSNYDKEKGGSIGLNSVAVPRYRNAALSVRCVKDL